MSRLPLIDPANAPAPAGELLAAVKSSLGVTPNMTRAMANGPALLEAYLAFSGALSRGVLPVATRERIALAVAQSNRCDYCLSAHSYLAEHVAKLRSDEIAAARKATSDDPKTAAVLAFAEEVNESRGAVSDEVLEETRAAGVTDEEIAETIGHVALNVLTNYFNIAIDVDVDFPRVTA